MTLSIILVRKHMKVCHRDCASIKTIQSHEKVHIVATSVSAVTRNHYTISINNEEGISAALSIY